MMKAMIERYVACNKLQSRVKVLHKSPEDITSEDLGGRKVRIVFKQDDSILLLYITKYLVSHGTDFFIHYHVRCLLGWQSCLKLFNSRRSLGYFEIDVDEPRSL